jgi:Rrf2 family protein
MLTGTSELAIRALIVIGLDESDEPLSPNQLSETLDCSPSYLAKVLRGLVRGGVLDSYRGARGGVRLAHAPEDISLLDVTEASQGVLVRNYCREIDVGSIPVCGFHAAMVEIREATTRILSRWTLADLLDRPAPGVPIPGPIKCKMHFHGADRYRDRSLAAARASEGGGGGEPAPDDSGDTP